jgi:transaldolase
MAEGNWYDDQLRNVLAEERDVKEIFLKLAMSDIEEACDLMRPVWDGGAGKDGYVSMEVDPNFAYDTNATIEEAARFHDWVDRPNLYVKIPATADGLPAIEEMIARGKNINVTLIFSLRRHEEVAEAYIRGLERLAEAGGDLSSVGSVASFFVSRVDTEADKRLDEATPSSRASWPSPTRSSRTRTTSGSSPGRAGMRSSRRAPRRSGASGRRPRRRTRSTATCCTSRS